jgi:Ca2+-binding EF-hand superfamily protein
MKVMFRAACVVLTLVLVMGSDAARSQEAPKEGAKKRSDRPRPGAPGGAAFTPPANPFFEALDANKDGEISAEELNNAVAALKKLDKDGDGKLTREETRPAGFGRGFGGFGGFGGTGAGGAGNSAAFVERIMANDKNKDGKVTKDELPENAQGLLDRLDENKDGALDKAELEKAGQNFGRRGGRPGQPGGAPGASNRPKRPTDSQPSEKPAEKK